MSGPSARRVVARAFVSAALAARASIERDYSGGARELHAKLPAWLREVAAWDEVDPLDEEVLVAPIFELGEAQLGDARWSNEHVAVLAWAVGRAEAPPEGASSDGAAIARGMGFLQGEGRRVLDEAALRPSEELRAALDAVRGKPDPFSIVRRVALEWVVGERETFWE